MQQKELGFDEFLDLALYDPEAGYYGSGRARLGTHGGDFFTNISVGSIYGEILAGQILETWQQLGRPHSFCIFEQGANDGQLMADVLGELEKHGEFFCAVRVFLIEPLAVPREKQKAILDAWRDRVEWLMPGDSPAVDCGFFLANELVDAMPFALAEFAQGCWRERTVLMERGENPVWSHRSPSRWLAERLVHFPIPRHEPFLLEVIRDLPHWARGLGGLMRRGVVLLCDYGFAEEELFSKPRPEGTYQCYSQHRRDADPLRDVGHKDITAHVNFTELRRCLSAGGWSDLGFLDQHHFLVGAATPWMQNVEREGLTAERQKKLRQLQTLLHPETMGAQFHFLVAGAGLPVDFTLSGLRHLR